MSVLSVNNYRIIESDSYGESIELSVNLDAPALVPVSFRYYTQDGTASSGRDFSEEHGTVNIPAGASSAVIRLYVHGNDAAEAEEAFDVVILPNPGLSLANGAAAAIAKIKIVDAASEAPSVPVELSEPATLVMGPASAHPGLPTMTVRDVTEIEADGYSDYATFLVTLDQPATAPVTFSYFTQEKTAAAGTHYTENAATGTIAVGARSTFVRVNLDANSVVGGEVSFQTVFTGISNAVFAGGAAVLTATATVLDSAAGQSGGVGGEAAQIAGPASAGTYPTVSAHDVEIVESAQGRSARVLVTLDAPTTVPLSVDWFTQDRTASSVTGDFHAASGTVNFAIGQKSSYVSVSVDDDFVTENAEQFDIIFTDAAGGQFRDNAAAIAATVTIHSNDEGGVARIGGIGNVARQIEGPQSASALVPTIQIQDSTMVEGGNGTNLMRFLVTLDRPSNVDVTFEYRIDNGSASMSQDGISRYYSYGTATIKAGETSANISASVRGDYAIEGNESFGMMIFNPTGAVLANNAVALRAEGTIIDDDGTASPPVGSGIGAPAKAVLGPVASDRVTATVVSTRIVEDNETAYADIYVLLSEPARAAASISYRLLPGTATTADYTQDSGTLNIAAGDRVGVLRINITGDTLIENDEAFQVQFHSPKNVTFANGNTTMSATVQILDDDSGVTRGEVAGAQFTLTRGPTSDADILSGTPGADTLDGGAGDDTIHGANGPDLLQGGAGNDRILGGDGTDRLYGGTGDDFIFGGSTVRDLRDVISGGEGNDRIDAGYGNDEVYGDAGNDTLDGGFGSDRLIGGDGNDQLSGAALSDELFGGTGADYLNGGFGHDRMNGGAGGDSFYHLGIRDHGSDWIQDFSAADGDRLIFGQSAGGPNQFKVNFVQTRNAGSNAVDEAFVIYAPTGQIVWALVDGAAQERIDIQIGGQLYDLL